MDECTVESDLELLFPNEYIPSSSERMLLYRELDKLELDRDVEAFKERLVDRFGKIPPGRGRVDSHCASSSPGKTFGSGKSCTERW